MSTINMFNIPNYSFIHSPCKSKRGCSVGIYIHNMSKIVERPDLSIFIEGSFESIFVEIVDTNLE